MGLVSAPGEPKVLIMKGHGGCLGWTHGRDEFVIGRLKIKVDDAIRCRRPKWQDD